MAAQHRQLPHGPLRRQPADITNNWLVFRTPPLPELFTALCWNKTNHINITTPAVDVTNFAVLQVPSSRRRWCQCSNTEVINRTCPQPCGRGESRQFVALGKTRSVRLIDGHSRDAQRPSSQSARTTEYGWRSQADNARPKLRQRRRCPAARHIDRQ